MWGLLLAVAIVSGEAPVDPTDTLVVCPPALEPAMRPWMNYRERQGRVVKVITPSPTAAELSEQVRKFVKLHPNLRWVTLVGDAGPGPHQTPTHILKAEVNIHFGSEPEIASDNPTADIDGDGVPDVAIGRLPADTPAELTRMIEKIQRYEQHPPGIWKRQVNFVAGVGGFGFVDTLIEMVTKQFLTDGIPPDYCTSMTYGSWKSVYCPSPPAFHTATVERLNEGCLFWVYIGHGNRYTLDRVNVPGGQHHILDVRDMPKLKARTGPAIAVMLACYTGAFDSPKDCLAEEMVRAPGGPVAALAGSRVTMPYAMAVLGNGLLEQHFVSQRETLGEVFLHAKRGLVAEPSEAEELGPLAKNRQLLDMLAHAVSPKPSLVEAERREHLALFNLIGDPLLAIRHPKRLELTVTSTDDEAATAQITDVASDVAAPKVIRTSAVSEEAPAAPLRVIGGEKLQIRGASPLVGRLRVELVSQRDQQRVKTPTRGPYVESRLAMREFDRTYVLANDREWSVLEQTHRGGEFVLEMEVPEQCQGPCFVRAFLDTQQQHAMGALAVYVRPTPKKK